MFQPTGSFRKHPAERERADEPEERAVAEPPEQRLPRARPLPEHEQAEPDADERCDHQVHDRARHRAASTRDAGDPLECTDLAECGTVDDPPDKPGNQAGDDGTARYRALTDGLSVRHRRHPRPPFLPLCLSAGAVAANPIRS